MIMGRVSHETIYQALYVQTRGSLRKDLYRQLSTKRPRRQPRGGNRRANSPYREAFKISQRPAEVADRAVPGHWEGDLVMGTAGGVAVGTLVERSTRFTILLHLPDRHDAETVAEAMIREMSQLPEHLRLSLTWDRGTELARYDKVQLDLGMPVYFCDPHAPWQRGHQREHQPAAAALADQGHRPVEVQRGRPPSDRRQPERAATPYPGHANPSPSAGRAADQTGSSVNALLTPLDLAPGWRRVAGGDRWMQAQGWSPSAGGMFPLRWKTFSGS